MSAPPGATDSGALTVTLTHPGGGSAESADYTLAQKVTIPRGSSTKTTDLRVVDDLIYEGSETITIQASAAGFITSSPLTVTIADDESEPDPEITVSPARVSEPSGTATVTATLTVAAEGATTFTLTHPGNGTAGSSDYTLDRTVTIPGGAKSATKTLSVVDDTTQEVDETVEISAGTRFGNAGPVTVTIADNDQPQKPEIYSIRPGLQRPDDPVAISGNHFGTTAGSVSFGGHTVGNHNFTGSNPGYSWSNTSIRLLIPGSIHSGPVTVTVTAHNGGTSEPYPYTVTGGPVQRGECDGEEDCPEEKEKEESEDSGEGEEDPAEGGG